MRHAWQAARGIAARAWMERPGPLVIAYLILIVAATTRAGRIDYPGDALAAFLCWRVWRGGPGARGFLIYGACFAFTLTDQFFEARTVAAIAAGWLGFGVGWASLALMLSPAVYARTHPGPLAAAARLSLRPPRWMLPLTALAGTAAASLALAVPHRWYVPAGGCLISDVSALPARCVGSGRGFPDPVMAAVHGHHTVSLAAFAIDCLLWATQAFWISYLILLARRRRPQPAAQPRERTDLVSG